MKNPADWIPTCTVRIEGESAGRTVSYGTGFFYDFLLKEDGSSGLGGKKAPVVVTNKHVIENCETAKICLTVESVPKLGEFPAVRRLHVPAKLALGKYVIPHPDADVDLCAIPAAALFARVEAEGERQYQVAHNRLWKGHRLATTKRADIRFIEPVVMVGYPNGLWDNVNNSPIVRRGSTATHPLVRYEGRGEFLIDAACFPGSSGSPVFLFQDGFYSDYGQPHHGIRTALLGVLYAGPQYNAEGELVPLPVPTGKGAATLTSIPMNLGYVISADELDALEPLVRERYEASIRDGANEVA
jgi:hypothetical protein